MAPESSAADTGLIAPHGGTLVNRVLAPEARAEALARAAELPRVVLNARAMSDLEMLAVGAFSPLDGFMRQADYRRVLHEGRLDGGLVWTLPITLAVKRRDAETLKEGAPVALIAPWEELLGILHLEERYAYDRHEEARLVYGTEDAAHPGVAYLLGRGDTLLGGPVDLIARPPLAGFEAYRLDPADTRALFRERGWRSVVGFQTRNPIHRSHEYIQKCALELTDGLLIHPLVGKTKLDDVPSEVRFRCYRALVHHYFPPDRVALAVFPGAMRYAGPREAVFHALVRKNYGCTHFIVGRDAAGVGRYYAPYAAHDLLRSFRREELGIEPLFFTETFFCRRCEATASGKTCPHGDADRVALSGTRVRELLGRGDPLPPEFTRPEVAAVLAEWARSELTGAAGGPLSVSRERRVRLLDAPLRSPATVAEQAAAAILGGGTMPFGSLAEQVAHELYLDEVRRGGWIVDLGIFGGSLFVGEAARAIEAGHGLLWEIAGSGETRR